MAGGRRTGRGGPGMSEAVMEQGKEVRVASPPSRVQCPLGMPRRISKSERLLNFAAVLLRERAPVRREWIRENVNGYTREYLPSEAAFQRTFERDKRDLEALGVPIEKQQIGAVKGYAVEAYHLPKDRCFLKPVQLDDREQLLLRLAAQAAYGTDGGGALAEELRSALRKLEFCQPFDSGIAKEAHLPYHVSLGFDADRKVGDRLAALVGAIHLKRRVRFAYRGADGGKAKPREIEPYAVCHQWGAWYLLGRSVDQDEVRIYRLNRFVGKVSCPSPRSKAPEYEIPKDFRIEEYLPRHPWQFKGGVKPIRAKVAFDAMVGWNVAEQFPEGACDVSPDGSAVLTCEVSLPESFASWVAGFSHHARILGPASIQKVFREHLRRVAALHGGKEVAR